MNRLLKLNRPILSNPHRFGRISEKFRETTFYRKISENKFVQKWKAKDERSGFKI